MRPLEKRVILFCISVVVLFSCSQSETSKVVDFSEVKILKGEKITSINPYVFSSMEVIDNILVVVNSKGDYIFQFFDVRTDSLIMATGRKGKGPGEFFDPSMMFHSDIRNQKQVNSFEIFDCVRRRLTNVNLTKTLLMKELIFHQERLPNRLGVIDKVWYQSDSMIIYRGEDEGRFTIFNTVDESSKIIPYKTRNFKFKTSENIERFLYYTAVVDLNLSRKIIVTAPINIGQLDYYNFNGDFLYSMPFEDSRRLEEFVNNPQKGTLKIHVNEIRSDANNIYALNVNCYDPEHNIEQDTNSEILLFNWEGSPIKKYKLDRIISSFAVDFKNQCIYGYAPFEHDYAIIKYKL